MSEDVAKGDLHLRDISRSRLDPEIVALIREHQRTLLPFIAPYIGKKNLDIGCGTGIPSLVQRENLDISPTLCDVVDIRDGRAKSLPFCRADGSHLPFTEKSFDSSCIQYVLHHTATREEAITMLKEAFRVSKRLILIEEIRGDRTDIAFAKAHDEATNTLMHSSILMPVREYFSTEEVETIIGDLGHKVLSHRVISRGSKVDGFLEKHLFVAE